MQSDPARYGTQVLLARATGLDQKSWSNYLSCESKPSRLARRQIQRKMGIPTSAWDLPLSEDPRNVPTCGEVSQGPVPQECDERPSLTGTDG
jgi:hypothetical protein